MFTQQRFIKNNLSNLFSISKFELFLRNLISEASFELNTAFIHPKWTTITIYYGFHQAWYQGIVKATVSGVSEDLKFEISEG